MDHRYSTGTRILKSSKSKAAKFSTKSFPSSPSIPSASRLSDTACHNNNGNSNINGNAEKDQPNLHRRSNNINNSHTRMISTTERTERRRRRVATAAAAPRASTTATMVVCVLLLSSWTSTRVKTVSAFVTRNGITQSRPSLPLKRRPSCTCDNSNSALNMATDSRELRFFAAAASTPSSQYTAFASSASGRSISKANGVNGDAESSSVAQREASTTAATTSSVTASTKNNMAFESVGSASAFYSPSHYSSSSAGSSAETLRHQTAVLFSSDKPRQSTTSKATAAEKAITQDMAVAKGTSASKKPFMQLRYHSTDKSSSSSEDSGPTIHLTPEEKKLFKLLVQVIQESPDITSTLRVAGGWVRDKLLATDGFRRIKRDICANVNNDIECEVTRLTSKYKSSSHDNASTGPSAGRHGTKVIGGSSSSSRTNGEVKALTQASNPVDIDIALDDMLGRDFAERLNHWLSDHGRQTHSVGVVLKNPEKSKHLETATMKVGKFWIDFVNLRAEEYTEDSRIPDLMRIGTPTEDAYRRDLTINALFYNINTGRVEDMTGRGFDDLKRGIVATPLPALTTLLDDPLRVLRAIRFAARLRFSMDESLRAAAADTRVREALAQKVSKERIGSEVDLMLRSPDPVGAMRLLTNLGLAGTVFPLGSIVDKDMDEEYPIFDAGLHLLSTTHDHLCYCKANPPVWCSKSMPYSCYGVPDYMLMDDDESRRVLWYAAFLKPLRDYASKVGKDRGSSCPRTQGKKSTRSVITHMMVDQLKRPSRDAEASERIMKAADDFTRLMTSGFDSMSMKILLSEIRVFAHHAGESEDECDLGIINGDGRNRTEGKMEQQQLQGYISCSMVTPDGGPKVVDAATEDNPLWLEAMEFRLLCSKVLQRIGPLWRAALILSLAEQLEDVNEVDMIEFAIEGDVIEESKEEVRQGIIAKYDAFAASLLELGLVGIWCEQPLIDGREMKQDGVLPNIPKGPVFREIMDEQSNWMITHPGADKNALIQHLHDVFPEFV